MVKDFHFPLILPLLVIIKFILMYSSVACVVGGFGCFFFFSGSQSKNYMYSCVKAELRSKEKMMQERGGGE